MNDPLTVSENKVEAWYSYLNDVVGVLCFSMAVAAWSIAEYSEEIATVGIIFVCLWCFFRGARIRRHQLRLDRLIGKIKSNIHAVVSTPVFMAGFGALLAVSAGLKPLHLAGFSINLLLNLG